MTYPFYTFTALFITFFRTLNIFFFCKRRFVVFEKEAKTGDSVDIPSTFVSKWRILDDIDFLLFLFLLSAERPNGNAKRGGRRRQFHQTTVRHHPTNHASYPATDCCLVVNDDGDGDCGDGGGGGENSEYEEPVKRQKLERSTGTYSLYLACIVKNTCIK